MHRTSTMLNHRGTEVSQALGREQTNGEFSPDSLHCLETLLKAQWKRYRKCLERCQEDFSEDAVHKWRVQTRRLLSTVKLLGAFVRHDRIKQARRALKRHLDVFDDLRDTQVQLVYVGKMLRTGEAGQVFHAYLSEREDRHASASRKRIKRIKTRRLGRVLTHFKAELIQERNRCTSKEARAILMHEMNRAYARVVRLQARIDPGKPSTVHRARIAFKRFRYMAETLAPLMPGVTKKGLAAMHRYQTMMGDIQDISVLLTAFTKFLQKRGVDAGSARHFRDELVRRRQRLIRRYLGVMDTLEEFRPVSVAENGPESPMKQRNSA